MFKIVLRFIPANANLMIGLSIIEVPSTSVASNLAKSSSKSSANDN